MILSVVGLIMPIWPAPNSVNQRLPSGPKAMRKGSAFGVGIGNSEMAWVAGSIVPILSAPNSVNQIAVARPGRHSVGSGARAAGHAELGDRGQQPTRFEAVEGRAGAVRLRATGGRRSLHENKRRDHLA